MRVVFVLGPTASGKSDFAFALAKKYSGVIMNCDSIQFYQKLNIGSAKPSAEEMQEIPHYLYDIASPGEDITAGDYRRWALETLRRLSESGQKLVICVGGSGFYFKALYYGMFDLPKIKKSEAEALKEKYEVLSSEALYEKLKEIDQSAAERLHPNDRYRVFRALEVKEVLGKSIIDFEAEFEPEEFPYLHLKLGISRDRQKLHKRIQARTESMLHKGWIQEVESLLQEGYRDWKALKSVGYREVVGFLEGDLKQEDLVPEITKSTRQLAKKQMTWFRKEPALHWINVDAEKQEAFKIVESLIQQNHKEQ